MYLCFFRVASHGGVVEVSWSEMVRMKVWLQTKFSLIFRKVVRSRFASATTRHSIVYCLQRHSHRHACTDTPGISSSGTEEGTAVPHRRSELKVPLPVQSLTDSCRTARQRKPLEVIGVYDPIPRYPTTPAGEIL